MRQFRSPFFIFSLILIFLLFFLAPVDSDLGWHIRYGEYFLKTGHFLKNNILTYYLPDYYWQNSYGFYQILISIIHQSLGFLGLSFLNSLLFVAAFYFFYKIHPQTPKLNLIFFLLIAVFGWSVFNLGFRSQEFTFVFLIVIFYFLQQFEKELFLKKYYLYLITVPLLFIFWVNLHGGFILGLIILSFATLSYLINRNWHQAAKLALITSVSFIGTLVNPYFLGIYTETLKHFSYPLPTLIAEWVAPGTWYQIIIVILAFYLIFSFASAKNKQKVFWLLSIFSIAYLAIKSQRNLPEFALISTLGIFNLFTLGIAGFEKTKFIQKLAIIILITGIPFSLFSNVTKTFSFSSGWNNYCTQGILPYPCKAVDFIKLNNIPGKNIFSSYEWGGFLEWQLPNYKFFVDGRTPAWETPEGKSPYTVYLEIIQARPDYQKDLKNYQTDWLLIGVGTFLDIDLQNNKNSPWKEIYRDNISVIYLPR